MEDTQHFTCGVWTAPENFVGHVYSHKSTTMISWNMGVWLLTLLGDFCSSSVLGRSVEETPVSTESVRLLSLLWSIFSVLRCSRIV